MPETLDILLHDRLVGTVTNLGDDRNVFLFDSAYAEDRERPTLSLSFFDENRNLSEPTKTPHVRLLPFFANLLPEGHLHQYLADRGKVNPNRDFPLLWLLGEDLPGAVTAVHGEGRKPREDSGWPTRAIEEDPDVLKFSLAGVQLKFSAIRESSGGLTIPAHGRNGHWIVKMPSPIYDGVPENEFAMMTFAAKLGIEVPELELVDSSSIANMPAEIRLDLGSALAVKRFDRTEIARVHVEDFNQIYNQYPASKYDNVSYGNMLRDIWRILGERDAREFVRRLVFSIGIGNSDMHLKNWCVIYRDGKTPALAPAYDFLSTIVYLEDDKLALSMSRTKRWGDITYDLLERFARKAEVPRGIVLASARQMVSDMRDAWPQMSDVARLPAAALGKIERHMDSIPIFTELKMYGLTPTRSNPARDQIG